MITRWNGQRRSRSTWLQNSRLNPDEASSLVDLERRIPAKCAFFAQLMRESRKLKTRWRSRVNSYSRATFDWPDIIRESYGIGPISATIDQQSHLA
jgi:hypothetical protein